MTAKLIFVAGSAVVLWVLHRWIGHYPPGLPRSRNVARDLRGVLVLWLVAIAVPILRIHLVAPWLDAAVPDRTLRELVMVPVLTVPYVIVPLWLIARPNCWSREDLGLVWRTRSTSVATFAVAFGVLSGIVPFVTGQAVMGFDPLPAGEFLLLIYTNTFLEEFFHRGVIQSTLERALGQAPAVLWGGVLFGLTHVAFDVARLASTEGWLAVALAVLLQTMAGWLFGIIYMKTRSLWPGMACHYLVNWLSAILVSVSAWAT